jgi:hypothetical protein
MSKYAVGIGCAKFARLTDSGEAVDGEEGIAYPEMPGFSALFQLDDDEYLDLLRALLPWYTVTRGSVERWKRKLQGEADNE